MDKKELQEKIALYYSKLTPKAQASFASMVWLDTLKQIAEKYALNQKQVETLSTETTLVLLGVIHLNEYTKTLYNELELPKEITEKILLEIDNSILKSIRNELDDVFNKNTKELELEQIKKYEEVDERFQKLPKEIQEALGRIDYHEALYKIFEKNKLNIEQMGILENSVMDVLMGTTRPENFKDSLKANLTLPEEKIQTIVQEVNEEILKEIKNQVIRANRPEEKPRMNHTEEDRIMKSAGIEIKRDEAKTPRPQLTKLFGSVKTPITNTDHSLSNITKEGQKTPEKVVLTASTEISAPKEKKEISQAPTPTPKTENPSTSPTAQKTMNDIKKPTISISQEEKIPDSKPASYIKNKDPYRMSPDE